MLSKKLYNELSKRKVFLFDFDGTLLNSEKYHMKAHSFVLSKILNKKYKMKYKIFNNYVGNTDDIIFEKYKTDFDVNFDKEEMINLKVEKSRQLLKDKKVKIFNYFFKLKEKFINTDFYIVSNQEEEFLKDILENKKIIDSFKEIISVPKLKIKKEEFLSNIYQNLGTKPKQCVLFEDVDKYLKCAKSLGMFAVGIESKRNKKSLKSADYIIKAR